MNIVETKKIGDTTVNFCDDCYRGKEEKEIEDILKSITDKTLPYLQKKTA